MWKTIRPCAAAVALAGGLAVPAGTETPARSPCCFVNDQYAGVCTVVPAARETCGSILAYLNNPRSQGKNYCRNTEVRGGWQRRQCASPTAKRAGQVAPRAAGP